MHRKCIYTLISLMFVLCPRAFAQMEDKPANKEEAPLELPSKPEAKQRESDVSKILESVGYPELQVVPRASERLRLEEKAERGSWFVTHWPIELSGLATLGVALTLDSNLRDNLSADDKSSADSLSTVGMTVGAAWIIGGVIIGAQKPYRKGMRSVSRQPTKDERGQLMKERLAEEALERPARTMRVLKHVSVVTNAAVNLLAMAPANDQGKVYAGIATVLAFLPYMFEDHNIAVYQKHIEYKKKIYAPIKSASVHIDPVSGATTPMTTLTWMF